MWDIVIIGGGPAGLTCAIYAGRAGRKAIVLEGDFVGGQVTTASLIENYPGFPQGIDGFELASLLEAQAKKWDVEIRNEQVLEFDLANKRMRTANGLIEGRTIVLAMGATPRRLAVGGEMELNGRGVSYCATCDGAFYKGKTVAVVGGGDTACEDAAYLSALVETVYLVHRRDTLRAASSLAAKVLAMPNVIPVWNATVTAVCGERTVESVMLNTPEGERSLNVEGIFVAVGTQPQTKDIIGQVKLNNQGYVMTDDRLCTDIPGIYAVGDIREKALRQVVTAVADGALAAYHIEQFLA